MASDVAIHGFITPPDTGPCMEYKRITKLVILFKESHKLMVSCEQANKITKTQIGF